MEAFPPHLNRPDPATVTLRAAALVLACTFVALPPGTARAQAPEGRASAGAAVPEPLDVRLRLRVEGGRTVGMVPAGGRPALAVEALPAFYLRRAFAPAWIQAGRLAPRAAALVAAIREAAGDGLRPADYHLAELERRVAGGPVVGAPDDLEVELLLTDAFLVLGSHLLHGRVDPLTIHPEWRANRRDADLATTLEAAIAPGGPGVVEALDALRPRQPEYGRLRQALARLRGVEAAGGWPKVGPGPTLRPGDRDARVALLRDRLRASGDLGGGGPGGDQSLYDEALAGAARAFQRRHGLGDDAAVGARTVEALDVPARRRREQVEASLERWRWLPDTLGSRHVRVNIAAFQTRVYQDGEEVLALRSVVGRQYRETPVFSGTIRYLVLSPYWHVPPNIAAVDKLPEIRRDPGYVAAQDMTLFDAASGAVVDPRSVAWGSVGGDEFNRRFRLRQNPGPSNALGDVKFMFPNRWNVYLHDTPSRELFGRDQRDFSSGCIRVERPLELAALLLSEDPSWSVERITRTVAARVERSVTLPNPVPVHILYWTAFVDPDGSLHFRPDVYGRDARLLAALQAEAPGP